MPGFSTFCPATDCACCLHSVPQCPHSSLSNATVLQVMHVCLVVSLSCPTLQPHGLWTARLLCSWNFPGKNTGLPFPSDLPDPEIKPASLASPEIAGGFFTTSATWGKCACVCRDY